MHYKADKTKRIHNSILFNPELRALRWMAQRLPRAIGPDHLTALALGSMFLTGLSYFFSSRAPIFLFAASFWLVVNWFGDSLDGTVARVRNQQRPRYGYYVDHICDAFGALFLFAGLASSGIMSERVGLALLIAYFLIAINSYLAACSIGEFRVSFWRFGPTELRLLLIAGNTAAFFNPTVRLFGQEWLFFDVGGLIGAAGITLVTLVSAIQTTKRLYAMERVES